MTMDRRIAALEQAELTHKKKLEDIEQEFHTKLVNIKLENENLKEMFIELLKTVELFSSNTEDKIRELEMQIDEMKNESREGATKKGKIHTNVETKHESKCNAPKSSEPKADMISRVFTKDIRRSLEALTIATSPTKDVSEPNLYGNVPDNQEITERLETEAEKQCLVYRCDICQEICKRAVRTPCCRGQACRACAFTFLTSKRACWWCANTQLHSDKLINFDKLRNQIELFKKNNQL